MLTPQQNLTTLRTNLHTSRTLIQTLSDLPSKATSLPPELHSVIELATAQLSGYIPPSDRAILAADIETFLSHLPTISAALSTQLTTIADLLCTICDPKNPPSIDALPARAEKLRDAATTALPADLAEAKLHLANTAYAVLTTHRTLLQTSIRILEQTQHGTLTRTTKSRAEHLHARAALLGLQARIHTHTHPPPAEFVAALKNFKAEQGASEKGLRDREALARRELELYRGAGEKGMRDLARRKVWLRGEIERVEAEIGSLERGE